MTPLAPLEPNREAKALSMAWSELRKRDLGLVASRSWSDLVDGALEVPYLEMRLTVDVAKGRVSAGGEEAEQPLAILALHYLLGCGERQPSGKAVPFTYSPGGELYFPAFKKRTIDRLAEEFGPSPARLVAAGLRLGGEPCEIGSACVRLRLFPKLTVAVIVWEGDDEVPAAANMLFDELALEILPTEDLAVAGSLVSTRLRQAARR